MNNFINKNLQYAVVGATNNTEKYGFKVFADLLAGGYKVFPINPKKGEILNKLVYEKLSETPAKIDVVIFVVPPQIVVKELELVQKLGIQKVWMQPGSESDEAVTFCDKNKIQCMHDACIMIKRIG